MCMPLSETLRSGEQRRRGSSAGCPGLVSPAPHAHVAAPLHLCLWIPLTINLGGESFFEKGREGWKTKRGGKFWTKENGSKRRKTEGKRRTVTCLSTLSLHRLEAHRHLPDHREALSASSQHHQILPHDPAASLKTSQNREPQAASGVLLHIPNRQLFSESRTSTQPSPASTTASSSAPAAIAD